MMTLNNGTADEQAHPHSLTPGRIESVEELLHVLQCNAHARILYGQAHAIVFVSFGSDEQLPWTGINAAHRVRGIAKQVEDDLLQLNSIACDRREIDSKSLLQDY